MRKGFTLSEVLMSLTIIVIVILFCFGLFSRAYEITRVTEGDLVANNIANQQLEYFRSSFYRIPTVGGPYSYDNPPTDFNQVNFNPPITIRGKTYYTSVIIYKIPGSSADKIKRVVVTVSRQDKADVRKITVEAIFSNTSFD
jgi:prepilin-type N-terminal cleavage/methylation domain-containing protein